MRLCEEEENKLVGRTSYKACNITQPVSMVTATTVTAVSVDTVPI